MDTALAESAEIASLAASQVEYGTSLSMTEWIVVNNTGRIDGDDGLKPTYTNRDGFTPMCLAATHGDTGTGS